MLPLRSLSIQLILLLAFVNISYSSSHKAVRLIRLISIAFFQIAYARRLAAPPLFLALSRRGPLPLSEALQNDLLWDNIDRVRSVFPLVPNRAESSLGEHIEILHALQQRDGHLA